MIAATQTLTPFKNRIAPKLALALFIFLVIIFILFMLYSAKPYIWLIPDLARRLNGEYAGLFVMHLLAPLFMLATIRAFQLRRKIAILLHLCAAVSFYFSVPSTIMYVIGYARKIRESSDFFQDDIFIYILGRLPVDLGYIYVFAPIPIMAYLFFGNTSWMKAK